MNRHVPPHDFEQGDIDPRELDPRELDPRELDPRELDPRELDPRGAAVFTPRTAPDFQRAQRHSARVRWIRRLLPLSIVVAVLVIGAGALISRFQLKLDLPFDMGHLTLSGTRLTMELPKLSGFTDDNRGYSVTAKTASQDLTRPDVIELSDIEARLEMAEKGWTSVQAKAGSFDTKKQFITLNEGVELAMKGGYGGHLQDAEVDVKAGTIKTAHPVLFTYLDGRLVADRLQVTDRGEKALFEGNVQLDFRLSSLPGGQRQTAPGASQDGRPANDGRSPGAAQPAAGAQHPLADNKPAEQPATAPVPAPRPVSRP